MDQASFPSSALSFDVQIVIQGQYLRAEIAGRGASGELLWGQNLEADLGSSSEISVPSVALICTSSSEGGVVTVDRISFNASQE